jgi:hypothetical protein
MMSPATRSVTTLACLAALLALAVIGGFTTTVDEHGNLDSSIDPVVLLVFAALIIASVYLSGAMERLSTGAFTSSVFAFLAGLSYWTAALARHPGEFAMDGPLAVEIGFSAWGIAAFGAVAGVLGGVLGVGASAVYLGGRWLHDRARSRLGTHL